MKFFDRSGLPLRAIFLFLILTPVACGVCAATLEESARELAGKIATLVPAHAAFSLELHNRSSLNPDQAFRIEQALRKELQDRGARPGANAADGTVTVTLSENWEGLVWTAEIRAGDRSSVAVLPVLRVDETQPASNAMHVTVRGEKFWEGPDRFLDAVELADGAGKSWFVVLLPATIKIQDLRSGATAAFDITPPPPISRAPWGKLESAAPNGELWFAASSRMCKINLEAHSAPECLSKEEQDRPLNGRAPFTVDLAPPGPLPAGIGMALAIGPLCGGANQFLATSARDDTQPDFVQVFRAESNGPAAMSAELEFPGPVLALHTGDPPRAIVRNLSTGIYEAYRLAISCGQ